jgi:hypothetical protein
MRAFITIASVLALGSAAGCSALHQPGSVENPRAAPVCIASYDIDHTSIPDDKTILFFMRDRTVWKNTLPFTCYGLKLDSRGYTYEPTDPGSDTICSNLVTIHLNTFHNVCQLGVFTKITPPAKPAAP